MPSTFLEFKKQAMKRGSVKAAYDAQALEFKGLDQFLRARADAFCNCGSRLNRAGRMMRRG